jgi:hypothetical protein
MPPPYGAFPFGHRASIRGVSFAVDSTVLEVTTCVVAFPLDPAVAA